MMSVPVPVTKYHQVYLVLHEQLRDGKFAGGLPAEKVLMQQFGVARVTVRKALERLSLEGLIRREPGRGTTPITGAIPAVAKTRDSAHPVTGLLGNIVTMTLGTFVKVLRVDKVNAPNDIAAALRLAPDQQEVQKAIRVRSTKQSPISLITTYVPQAIAKNFGKRELSKKPILLLIEEAGVKVGRAEQNISACLADTQVAKHLEVEVGSALLAVRRLVFDVHDNPIQWLYGLYRPDRYEYQMQLSRVGDIDAQVWVSNNLVAQFH
jgi:GntR family transcriptional regulator